MHATKKQVVIKFALLLLVLLGYFGYLSLKFDIATGGLVALLTWSFFVLCTPVADAGFLLDFPLRLLLGIRMFVSEIFVWVIAIAINVFTLIFAPDIYQTTLVTSLFEKVITTPWPYWSIIFLSGIGTFLSIRFGDELMDVVSHKERSVHHKLGFIHSLILYVGLFVLIFIGYHHIAVSLGVGEIMK